MPETPYGNHRQPIEGCGGRRAMRLVEQGSGPEKGEPRFALLKTQRHWPPRTCGMPPIPSCARRSFLSMSTLITCTFFTSSSPMMRTRRFPPKSAIKMLMQLHQAWKAFFLATAPYGDHPEKFVGRPKLPKYKHKEHRAQPVGL